MSPNDYLLDLAREERIGVSEAVYCLSKSPEQVAAIVDHSQAEGLRLLLTRLSSDKAALLPPESRAALN